MKRILLVLLMFFASSMIVIAQKKAKRLKTMNEKMKLEREPETQGEQEVIWGERFLKENYKRMYFPRFKGTISKRGDAIYFDENLVEIDNTSGEMYLLLESGILYPGIFGPLSPKVKIQKQANQYKTNPIFPFIRTDSLRISDMEEIKTSADDKSTKSKRFRFLLWRKGFMNPSIYFIELTNNKATADTDIRTFIKDAELTFFKQGWVLI
jgi:hypothetical protein